MAFKTWDTFIPDRPKSKIGSFAGIKFEISSKKVLTFADMKRSETTRWTVHDIMGKKPLAEFNGPGQESISFRVSFKTNLNVDPWRTIKEFREFQNEGKVGPLMLGKKTIANSKFYIEDMQEAYRHIDSKGVIHTIDCDLTIKEYPAAKIKRKKKTNTKKNTTKKNGTKSNSGKKVTGTITVKVSNLNVRTGPSFKSKVKKTIRVGQKFKVYGTKKADGITWYDLGNGLWCSAVSKYTTFVKKK